MSYTPHFLIADDEHDIAFLLKVMVSHMFPQASITVVHNGDALLKAYAAQGADMVITDFQMPIRTGLEALRELRNAGDAVPVIVVTAYPALGKECETDPQTHCLVKPIDMDVLRKSVHQLLTLKECAVGSC